MDILVRNAVECDSAAVVALLADELGYPRETLGHVTSRLASAEKFPDLHTLVAEVDEEVVGMVTFAVIRLLDYELPQARVSSIAILPRFRRVGVASALAREVEHVARQLGCFRVELTSNHSLTDAHRFWEAIGYANSGLRFVRYLDVPEP